MTIYVTCFGKHVTHPILFIWRSIKHTYFTHPMLLIWKFIKTTGNGIYRFTIFTHDKGIVAVQSLQVLYLSVVPKIFCESPNLKNRMSELCMFLKIWSHYCVIL